MSENLERVSKWNDPMFSRATLYKWRHTHKFPDLFVKVGGALLIDRKVLAELVEAGRIN